MDEAKSRDDMARKAALSDWLSAVGRRAITVLSPTSTHAECLTDLIGMAWDAAWIRGETEAVRRQIEAMQSQLANYRSTVEAMGRYSEDREELCRALLQSRRALVVVYESARFGDEVTALIEAALEQSETALQNVANREPQP